MGFSDPSQDPLRPVSRRDLTVAFALALEPSRRCALSSRQQAIRLRAAGGGGHDPIHTPPTGRATARARARAGAGAPSSVCDQTGGRPTGPTQGAGRGGAAACRSPQGRPPGRKRPLQGPVTGGRCGRRQRRGGGGCPLRVDRMKGCHPSQICYGQRRIGCIRDYYVSCRGLPLLDGAVDGKPAACSCAGVTPRAARVGASLKPTGRRFGMAASCRWRRPARCHLERADDRAGARGAAGRARTRTRGDSAGKPTSRQLARGTDRRRIEALQRSRGIKCSTSAAST